MIDIVRTNEATLHKLTRPVTKRQGEILEYICNRVAKGMSPPTVREIGTRFNISSPNGVVCHLKALERKKLITSDQRVARGIYPTEMPDDLVPKEISVLGRTYQLKPENTQAA